jgi:Leucine-rich repeat (LRR) protein
MECSLDNEVTSVLGFSGLPYLQELDLSYNQIETIDGLDCPNLITLNLVRENT